MPYKIITTYIYTYEHTIINYGDSHMHINISFVNNFLDVF